MGMKVEFSNFNPAELEREVMRAAEGHLRQLASKLENALNGLGPAYKNKPVEEIKPVLQATWKRVAEGDLDDERADAFAEAIRIGQPIEIKYGGIEK